MEGISVNKQWIRIAEKDQHDFFCLTDIARFVGYDTGVAINNWLNTRQAIVSMGLWEGYYNPSFNHISFYRIKIRETLTPKLSLTSWITETQAAGLHVSRGRYGGTFAWKEIAFLFAEWIGKDLKIKIEQQYALAKKFDQELLHARLPGH